MHYKLQNNIVVKISIVKKFFNLFQINSFIYKT
jgi:hypothetical protein